MMILCDSFTEDMLSLAASVRIWYSTNLEGVRFFIIVENFVGVKFYFAVVTGVDSITSSINTVSFVTSLCYDLTLEVGFSGDLLSVRKNETAEDRDWMLQPPSGCLWVMIHSWLSFPTASFTSTFHSPAGHAHLISAISFTCAPSPYIYPLLPLSICLIVLAPCKPF